MVHDGKVNAQILAVQAWSGIQHRRGAGKSTGRHNRHWGGQSSPDRIGTTYGKRRPSGAPTSGLV